MTDLNLLSECHRQEHQDVNGPVMLEPKVTLAPTPCPGAVPVNVSTCVLLPVNDAPGKNVNTLSARV